MGSARLKPALFRNCKTVSQLLDAIEPMIKERNKLIITFNLKEIFDPLSFVDISRFMMAKIKKNSPAAKNRSILD
jgi:hypothetical protein